YENAIFVGPSLAYARAGHSATTLLDGKVLIAGGAGDSSELGSAEIYDPTANAFSPAANLMIAARQHHQAILLPHNSAVLIVGGTAGANGDAVTTADVYVAWQGNGGSFYETNVPTDVAGDGTRTPRRPGTARGWAPGGAVSF